VVAGARLDESLRESERRGIHATDIGLTVSGTKKKNLYKVAHKVLEYICGAEITCGALSDTPR
jgi:hypothetical protein